MNYIRVKPSDLKDINEKTKYPYLILRTSLFNFDQIIPLGFIAGSIWFLLKDEGPYTFPLILLCAIAVYRLWKNFSAIRIIRINTVKTVLTVSSRNPLVYIFQKNEKILFSDIKFIEIQKVISVFSQERRFVLFAVLRDSSKISLTQTYSDITAQRIRTFLLTILKSPR